MPSADKNKTHNHPDTPSGGTAHKSSDTISGPALFDFGTVADRYDNWYDTAEGEMYDRLEKAALRRFLPDVRNSLNNDRRLKLLEIGCGTGHFSRFFSGLGFEVTGVDISGQMLEKARSKNICNSIFVTNDAHKLPFADDSFDVSAAVTTLEFVRDAEAVLEEMVRCTRKPGGILLLGVLNKNAGINRNRQNRPGSLFAKARMFSAAQLREMLTAYGKVRITGSAFFVRSGITLKLAPAADILAGLLRLPGAAFLTAKVKLW